MIIVTDLLIICHLISVSLSLPYLPLVFRHFNPLPYLIKNLNKYNLLPNVVSKNSWMSGKECIDPDVTPRLRSILFAQACQTKYIQ